MITGVTPYSEDIPHIVTLYTVICIDFFYFSCYASFFALKYFTLFARISNVLVPRALLESSTVFINCKRISALSGIAAINRWYVYNSSRSLSKLLVN